MGWQGVPAQHALHPCGKLTSLRAVATVAGVDVLQPDVVSFLHVLRVSPGVWGNSAACVSQPATTGEQGWRAHRAMPTPWRPQRRTAAGAAAVLNFETGGPRALEQPPHVLKTRPTHNLGLKSASVVAGAARGRRGRAGACSQALQ